jgi:GMP synthase (glutamine-hydrolysing)
VTVEIVFTERRADLGEPRERNFERLREQVAAASGAAVDVAHYEVVDAARLAQATAIVLSGSTAAWSERDPAELARLGDAVRDAGRPVLGICAGMQLQALFAGGALAPAARAEHGFLPIDVHDTTDLLRHWPDEVVVFQDHTDEITVLPDGFRVLASSKDCRIQAIADAERRWWGTQFHPEESNVEHPAGREVLETFFSLVS